MKFYKSYMIIGLFALGLTACNTDDLERDLDALKDRVENFEAQVQKLNDDMNIIRVMLDGNKTISEWSYDGSKYTIKLSNGETLTLTQGVVGENYPSVTIGENGNWFIAGEDSGIKASAEKGPDAPYTPIFKIESGQWCVSHDNGTTWTNLGVSAVGSADTNPSPIKDVNTDDPNYMVFTLNNDQVYKIPVIKSLICEITEAEVESDGLMHLGYEDEKPFKLKVNLEAGDILRPVVPAEWKVEISDYTGKTGEQTLDVKVVAPASASKCLITIELNRGLNTVTDEIGARTNISNYWDEFQAGFDIVIGDVNGVNLTLNKRNAPLDVVHITNSSAEKIINKSGIYFVDSDVAAVYKRFGISDLIIIGTDPETRSKISLSTDDDYFNLAKTGQGLLLKNIELDLSAYEKDYIINEGSNDAVFEYLLFDECKFELKGRSSTSSLYFVNIPKTRTNIHIKNIAFYNNIVNVAASTGNINMVMLGKPDDGKFTEFENCVFVNNVFYSPQSAGGCDNFSLLQANMNELYMDSFKNITVSNNTIVNLLSKNGMMRARMTNIVSERNLIYNDFDVTSSRSWIIAVKKSGDGLPEDLGDLQISDNTCFDQTAKGRTWMMFHSNGYKPDNAGDYNFNYLDENPFETFDITNGVFKVSSKYSGLGSTL